MVAPVAVPIKPKPEADADPPAGGAVFGSISTAPALSLPPPPSTSVKDPPPPPPPLMKEKPDAVPATAAPAVSFSALIGLMKPKPLAAEFGAELALATAPPPTGVVTLIPENISVPSADDAAAVTPAPAPAPAAVEEEDEVVEDDGPHRPAPRGVPAGTVEGAGDCIAIPAKRSPPPPLDGPLAAGVCAAPPAGERLKKPPPCSWVGASPFSNDDGAAL